MPAVVSGQNQASFLCRSEGPSAGLLLSARTMPGRKGRTFAGARRHPISRVCAIWSIALILIPFTAPFKTIDLGSPTGGHSPNGLPKDKTDSDNKIGEPVHEFVVTHAPSAAGSLRFVRPDQIQEHPLQRAVLRL